MSTAPALSAPAAPGPSAASAAAPAPAPGPAPAAAPIPQRTAPLGLVTVAVASLQNAVLPALAIAISGMGSGDNIRVMAGLGVGLAIAVIGTLIAYLGWRRLTYIVGADDIRVESGVFSRWARSVPYERIQDVSLEARLLPRLLGLVAVRFETGAGGAEDLTLAYLTNAEGERLRQLVRERRAEAEAEAQAGEAPDQATAAGAAPRRAASDEAEVLFTMSRGRLVTFGLFEFSLAVFAVLGGLAQYADTFTDIDVWDVERWQAWLAEQGSLIAGLGPYVQAAGALAGLVTLIVIGFATGVARTVARDWGFVLERSPRGFRRRRGLFTRSDVMMPIHRVQGLVIRTGLLRYRFGWHGLSFVSLAQDSESASHVVAPFAQMEEIAPIVAAAGFRLPDAATEWHRASPRYRIDSAGSVAALFVAVAVGAGIWAGPGAALIALGLAVLLAGARLYAWQYERHALEERQLVATTGVFAPTSRIATRLKLHSVEIAQGPLARRRGYATVHFGLAGGELAIRGVPLARAQALRAAVLETIAATDFAHLDQARAA